MDTSDGLLKYILGGYNASKQDAVTKSGNLLQSLMYFGGAPDQTQAVDLKNTLGFDWPREMITPPSVKTPSLSGIFNGAGGFNPGMLPDTSVSVNPGEYKYKPAMGSEALELVKLLSKQKETQKLPTPNNVIGSIMSKRSQGLDLSDEESMLYDEYRTGKLPWFSEYMGGDELDLAAGVAGGLRTSANKDADIEMDMKKLSQKSMYDEKLLKLKQQAENNLMTRHKQNLISTDEFRKGMLNLKKKDSTIKNLVLTSLLEGEDLPDIDFSAFYGVKLPEQGGITVNKDQAVAVVKRIKAFKGTDEERKKLVTKLLGEYTPPDREFIWNLYSQGE